MCITPEKGQLVRIAVIYWEQDVHTIRCNNQMIDKNNLKPMGFLQTEQCHKTYKVTSDSNQSTQRPQTDWGPESGGLLLMAPIGYVVY